MCRGSSASNALWQDLALIIQLGVQSVAPLPLESGLIDVPLFHQGEPTLPQLDLVTFPSLRCATFHRVGIAIEKSGGLGYSVA